jgi:hypothetical protein
LGSERKTRAGAGGPRRACLNRLHNSGQDRDTRIAMHRPPRLCPTVCPTGPKLPMVKPNQAGS